MIFSEPKSNLVRRSKVGVCFVFLLLIRKFLVGKQNVKEKEKKKHSQIKNPGFLEPVIPCVGKRTSKEFQTA